jgi:hypothetical protein
VAIRIIDNKKLEMTEDEFTLYKNICRSYDRANFKGEELFRELFETDEMGIITFIRPPSVRQTSMEVMCFIFAIFQHQHIRLMEAKVGRLVARVEEKLKLLDK